MERLKNKKVFVGKYSKEIQEKAFELGFKWEHSEYGIKDMPFLFFNDGFITCLDSPDKFYNFFNNHEEVTPEYILSLEVEKKPKWEDFGEISGYFVSVLSKVEYYFNYSSFEDDANIFPTKEEAEACIALSQLCQWRDKYNEGWKADWSNSESYKYTIEYFDDRIFTNAYILNQRVLAFKSAKIRDKFLEDFKDLIEQAKPLL